MLQVEFFKSSHSVRQCPDEAIPDFAFIGRSNVGKSSLVNALTNRKQIAKVSGTPGKTQLINHFLINKKWFLVDLPGLGYARLSKNARAKLETMNREYLLKRPQLANTFVLVDIRHSLQPVDKDLMLWLGTHQIPFSIVFTKSDKLSPKKAGEMVSSYENALYDFWEELPPRFITSSEKKEGVDELLKYIENILTNFKP